MDARRAQQLPLGIYSYKSRDRRPSIDAQIWTLIVLRSRTHLALDKDAPEPRKRQSIDEGKVIAIPMVGGLHHRYTRRAA